MKKKDLPRLEQFHVADVSTLHITKKDSELLAKFAGKDGTKHPQLILEYECGFLVSTWQWMPEFHNNSADGELLDIGHSEAYVNLMRLSGANGNKWCCLDCDGEDYTFLPEYEW